MQDDIEPVAPVNLDDSGAASAVERGSILRQPGFGWGIGAGAIIVIFIVALAVGVLALVYMRMVSDEFAEMAGPATNVTLSPVSAGEPWFSINPDDTGVLEGWSYGSYGDGDSSEYAFDVFEVGSVDGLPIQHVMTMGADDDTQFFIGDDAYEPPDANVSPAASIFGDLDGEGNPLTDGEMKLIVEFRRDGDALIATKVTADPSSEPAPWFW